MIRRKPQHLYVLFGQDFVARLAKDLDGVDDDATILMIRSGELQRDLSLGYIVHFQYFAI